MWFVLGTAAELIKVYPLIERAQREGREWFVLATGQSGKNFWMQYEDFLLPKEKALSLLDTNTDLETSSKALQWFLRFALLSPAHVRTLCEHAFGKTPKSGDFWFVHGDTLSTLVGARLGARIKCQVVHIEAGMRSHNWKNPFPEEINRRLTARYASFHMCPDLAAAQNLKNEGYKKNVVVTGGNTVRDALDLCTNSHRSSDLPSGFYVLANLHRYENLNDSTRWTALVDVLLNAPPPVYLVLHPQTRKKLEDDPKSQEALVRAGVVLLDRQPFRRFIQLLHGASFLISDGGSNQEECFHLGKPCLILRDSTERFEGLDSTCLLSRFDPKLIAKFLEDPEKFRHAPHHQVKRPTDLIFEALK